MNDLEELINETPIETVNNYGKYKILGIICVLALLYIAKCCVYLDFKILTFLNPVIRTVFHAISSLILLITGIFR